MVVRAVWYQGVGKSQALKSAFKRINNLQQHLNNIPSVYIVK